MITPQTYIQEYIHTYIHIKPLPVPRVFGARSGSPRISLYVLMQLPYTAKHADTYAVCVRYVHGKELP